MKMYRALLCQVGDAPPQVTVLENTLDHPVVWTTFAVGAYRATSQSFSGKKIGHVGSIDGFNGTGMVFVTGRDGIDSMRAVNLDDSGNPCEIGCPAENYVEFLVYDP